MLRIIARVLGVVVAVLAIVGFFVEGEHLFGLMNVDVALDVTRVLIAAALLIVGFARVPLAAVRAVLIVVGAMYVVIGLVALASPTLGGILPTGFTGFDIGFHLIVGLGAVAVALVPALATEDGRSNSRTARA